MKARPLLQAVDFGDDVAEHDDQLSRYFVETSSFIDVITDRADLILGEKGSGKTAIFRHLADENAEIPELNDVDIIPAFNVQGMVIFRRLANAPELTEELYRVVWFTFIIGLIANYILSEYSEVLNLDELARLIDDADLKVGPPFVDNLWKRIENIIRSISNRLEVEGELEIGVPKLPLKARGTGRLRSHEVQDDDAEKQVDLEEVLYACDEKLAQLDRRCWLLFDRLDEAFEHNPALETKALRGLLRAHLDLTSYRSRLRTKLFLRSDVMDRITHSRGFVNATHLRRHRLHWDADAIVDLIARRIASSSVARDSLGIELGDLKTTARRLSICIRVLPSRIASQDFIHWIGPFSVDASEALNPRNVIGLLGFARKRQLIDYDRDDTDFDRRKPLIGQYAIYRGFEDLSRSRLEDTVLAEFNSLRPVVDAMRKGPARYSGDAFASLLKMPPNSRKLENLIRTLEYAGVVSTGKDHVTIARLYRPAMQITMGRRGEVYGEETNALTAVVEDAASRLRQGESRVLLGRFDNEQRKVIHRFVAARYREFRTRSHSLRVRSSGKEQFSRDLYDFKNLYLERPHAKQLIGSSDEDDEDYVHMEAVHMEALDEKDIEFLEALRQAAADSDSVVLSPPIPASFAKAILHLDAIRNSLSKTCIIAVARPLNTAPAPADSLMVRLVLGQYPRRLFYRTNRRVRKKDSRSTTFFTHIQNCIENLCQLVRAESYIADCQISSPDLFAAAARYIEEQPGVVSEDLASDQRGVFGVLRIKPDESLARKSDLPG